MLLLMLFLKPIQNPFLHMQPIFSLIKNCLGMCLESRGVDLFAAISGQTMHHQRVGLGQLRDRLLNLVIPQLLDAVRRFSFLAHGDPDIRIEQICTASRFLEVFRANNLRPLRWSGGCLAQCSRTTESPSSPDQGIRRLTPGELMRSSTVLQR